MAKKEFTRNEAISLQHRDRAVSMTAAADFIEKWELPYKEVVKLLREIASEAEMAVIETDMRDSQGYWVEDQGEAGIFLIKQKPGCR